MNKAFGGGRRPPQGALVLVQVQSPHGEAGGPPRRCSGPLTPGPGPRAPGRGWHSLSLVHAIRGGLGLCLHQVPQVSHAHLERREVEAVVVTAVTTYVRLALPRRRKEGQANRRRCCGRSEGTGEGEVLPEAVAVARKRGCHLQLPGPAAVP